MSSSSPSTFPLIFFLFFFAAGVTSSVEQQPLNSGGPTGNTVPAFPVVQDQNNETCHLDLSDELFGGVAEACGRDLDRARCCPVLAAWLFAAHARSALELRPSAADGGEAAALGGDMPMMPDDSQKCVNSLESSLQSRNIYLARPNASCDAVLCFCRIRLHQIGSLSCPAAFNVSAAAASSPASYRNATPKAVVRELEKNCRNSAYAGCTRCLESLDKLKGGVAGAGGSDRASRMFGRDCQLMGLTWLLARNRTAYIPTVSAVLRAIMYSAHRPPEGTRPPECGGVGGKQPRQYRCSPDQENMPLAVDSLEFEKLDSSSPAAAAVGRTGLPTTAAAILLSSAFLLSSIRSL